MKADLESLKEQASWRLLVNVTAECYYGSFEAMSLNERKYYREGILIKLPNKVKKCLYVRANLGKDWGNPTGRTECRYPEHKGKQTCAGEKWQSVGVRL